MTITTSIRLYAKTGLIAKDDTTDYLLQKKYTFDNIEPEIFILPRIAEWRQI